MRSTVLDGFAVNPGDLSWDFLSRFGEYSVYDSTPPELVAERLSGTDIVLTNRVKITPALLDSCKSIKFVTALGTGYDMIDVRAANGNFNGNLDAYRDEMQPDIVIVMYCSPVNIDRSAG